MELQQLLIQRDEENYYHPSVNYDTFTKAGLWSRLTFQWLNPLFRQGRVQKLELHHVPPPVSRPETAEEASSSLEDSLSKRRIDDLTLPFAIAGTIWRSLILNAIFAVLNTVASYVGPLLITTFVNILHEKENSSSDSYRHGLVLAFIFFFSKTVESLSQRQWYFGAQKIGVRVKAALTVLIYKKSLSIKYMGASNGKIINLISVDVEKAGDFCLQIHEIWLLPVQVILALFILYKNLGLAPSMVALVSTVLVMMSNTPIANKQKSLHSKIMEAKDARVKTTSETLKSMRVLKLNSWEPTFMKKVLDLRETEGNWLKRYLYTSSAITFLFWASPTLVSVVTFGVCIACGTPLTAATVFSALATFRILQEPIYNLPGLLSSLAQTKVSLERIEGFVREEDQTNIEYSPLDSSNASGVAVEMEVSEYAWGASYESSNEPTIRITESIKIMKGQKIAVCGLVGSGKSSFLCSILGEIPRISGDAVKVYGKKAYVPQSPWIQTGSVRDNIVFGEKIKHDAYNEVIEACALDQDIKTWIDGDLSIVGERGMNLSGGQKQRIQLARAVYSNADVYILDDPFSAVDAHTRSHLFEKCLMKLLSTKTVIYATHQLEYLSAADLVLVMKDGRIVQSGKLKDLIAESDGELQRQMKAHTQSIDKVNPTKENTCFEGTPCAMSGDEETEENPREPVKDHKTSDQEEETESGRVKWNVYSTFITASYRGALVPIVLLCHILFYVLQMVSSYWIAWATEEHDRISSEKMIGVFGLLSGFSSFFVLGRAILLTVITLETSQKLFLKMIVSVFRAPMSFFDSTPSCRVLSRCSTDQSSVDTDIPYRVAGLAFAIIQLFSVVVLMSQVAWQVFVLFLAILAISMWYQTYYIPTARELARMAGTRKAPILHHFSESISGAATIRCFNQRNRFLERNLDLVDDYSRVAFHNSGTMEWLSVRVNFFFNVGFFVVLVILVTLPRSRIDPSLAGLAATYGLTLNVLQAWVIWNFCNVENKMISVERILQFTKISSEAPLVVKGSRPSAEWPSEGKVELQDLQVRYAPNLPMVLKGVTCVFPGEKKIGIVGRTGSGKSTLIQALFRIVEPCGGRILIDGLDISKIGLHDLRSRLGIIPQDPTLFQGTVRTNLDPLEQHSDHEIWEVLKKCHLRDILRQSNTCLDLPVVEEGENLSVGQRQLVCLGRVLLKKRRILVLDEATASIDTATDNLMQKTLREETRNCTVITIAHRIPTIIDNDLVLVLDQGKVIEYDSPKNLLEDRNSAFSKLVAEFTSRSRKNDDHLINSSNTRIGV